MPMSNEVSKLLNSEDKGVLDATNVLSRLFRQILADINVTPLRWSELMVQYLNDPRNGIAKNSRERSTARGNLNKELRRPAMTWKTFHKGLSFLRPRRIRFEIQLEWSDKRTTLHSVTLDTGYRREEPEESDDE